MMTRNLLQTISLKQATQIGQLTYDLTCAQAKLEAETLRADAAEGVAAALRAQLEPAPKADEDETAPQHIAVAEGDER